MTGGAYYIDELHARAVDNGWELTKKLTFYSAELNRFITAFPGFFTDLASVPRPLRAIVPVANSVWRRAAVTHDLLCDPITQQSMGITQTQADAVLREAMICLGVPARRAQIVWFFVRIYQATWGNPKRKTIRQSTKLWNKFSNWWRSK